MKPITHEEIEEILDALFKDDPWGELTKYPAEDWQYEVRNGDTRLGYRGWLYNKLANEEEEVEPKELSAEDKKIWHDLGMPE